MTTFAGRQNMLTFAEAPRRVVCLVPSLTESMFDLGLGKSLVGITDYCLHPAAKVANLPRVGGTKNPRIENILALQPDLVIANQEENSPGTVEALEAVQIRVWLNFPKTVRQALDVLWLLVGIFRDKPAATRLETIELSLDWIRQTVEDQPPVRYFCPIWCESSPSSQPWWMTFNQQTYCHDLLALCGGENVFALRERCYPLDADLGNAPVASAGDRDRRYPRVTSQEVFQANPELIFLPSEPYPFSDQDREAALELFSGTEAGKRHRIFLVDGSLITWHGTRLGRALQILPSYFQNV